MKYRADIDGLRAIAVLPVLFFHIQWSLFSGGYVGVDVFFVISGYLVTSIIIKEIRGGHFSIVEFYKRRIRRIFPALVFVCFTTVMIGSVILLPRDFSNFAKSLISVSLFVSNFFFRQQSGYFDNQTEMKPLLHTWSLSVEEQFYIIIPIILLVLSRFRLSVNLWIWILIIGSFSLSCFWVSKYNNTTFYLLPTRAWELLFGSALALGTFPKTERRSICESAGVIGVGLILYAVLMFESNTLFPGPNALFPCVGAALVIWSGLGEKVTYVGRLLSLKPIVFVGLISYSLYLWHWPIAVYLRYYKIFPLSVFDRGLIIFTSFILAYLTWKYIEQTFRKPNSLFFTPRARPLFFWSAMSMGGLIVIAFGILSRDGIPERFRDKDALIVANGVADYSPMRLKCHSRRGHYIPPESGCIYGADVPPALAFYGDSHVVELSFAMGKIFLSENKSLLHLSYSGCPPAIDFVPRNGDNCAKLAKRNLEYLIGNPAIRTVVLTAYYDFANYADKDALFTGLERLVENLSTRMDHVILLKPLPPSPDHVPSYFARLKLKGRIGDDHYPTRQDHFAHNRLFFERLTEIVGAYKNVYLLDPAAELCKDGVCRLLKGNRPLYFDSHHLSNLGADIVARSLKEQLNRIFGEKP
jgi:peptidoglycan/LPS O-acetylase OafA/YrhL